MGGDDLAGVLEQDAPIAGRAQRVAVTDQHGAPDALFEAFDLPAHCGLRETEVLCGAGHPAPLEDGDVGPE